MINKKMFVESIGEWKNLKKNLEKKWNFFCACKIKLPSEWQIYRARTLDSSSNVFKMAPPSSSTFFTIYSRSNVESLSAPLVMMKAEFARGRVLSAGAGEDSLTVSVERKTHPVNFRYGDVGKSREKYKHTRWRLWGSLPLLLNIHISRGATTFCAKNSINQSINQSILQEQIPTRIFMENLSIDCLIEGPTSTAGGRSSTRRAFIKLRSRLDGWTRVARLIRFLPAFHLFGLDHHDIEAFPKNTKIHEKI